MGTHLSSFRVEYKRLKEWPAHEAVQPEAVKSERPHTFALRVQEVAYQLEFIHREKQPLCNLLVQVLKNLLPEKQDHRFFLMKQLDTLTFEDTVQALRDEYQALHRDAQAGSRHEDQAHVAQEIKRFTGKCHNCGKMGHKMADCRSKKQGKAGQGGHNTN